MPLFSEKMLIFKIRKRGLMPNLIKKSWTVSSTQAFLSSMHYYFYAWDASIQGTFISTPPTLTSKFNFQSFHLIDKIMILMNWVNKFKKIIIVLKSVHFKRPVTRSSFLSKSVVRFVVVILKMTTLFKRNEDHVTSFLKC